MAVPKRKISKTRARKRRTHWVAKSPQIGTCNQCNASIIPYRVCTECVTYKGRSVTSIKSI